MQSPARGSGSGRPLLRGRRWRATSSKLSITSSKVERGRSRPGTEESGMKSTIGRCAIIDTKSDRGEKKVRWQKSAAAQAEISRV